MYVFPIEKWEFIFQPAILVIPEGNPWKSKSKETRSFRLIHGSRIPDPKNLDWEYHVT